MVIFMHVLCKYMCVCACECYRGGVGGNYCVCVCGCVSVCVETGTLMRTCLNWMVDWSLPYQGCRFSVIFRYFWPDPFPIFSYFIFLFLNFLSLFVFIFCEMARTHRFSVIFTNIQWHPYHIHTIKCLAL